MGRVSYNVPRIYEVATIGSNLGKIRAEDFSVYPLLYEGEGETRERSVPLSFKPLPFQSIFIQKYFFPLINSLIPFFFCMFKNQIQRKIIFFA